MVLYNTKEPQLSCKISTRVGDSVHNLGLTAFEHMTCGDRVALLLSWPADRVRLMLATTASKSTLVPPLLPGFLWFHVFMPNTYCWVANLADTLRKYDSIASL